MTTTIEDLWHGNLRPSEKEIAPNSRYSRALQKVCESEQTLINLLGNEQKFRFDDFRKRTEKLQILTETDAFTEGFKLGMKMAVEVFAADKRGV